MKNIFKTALVSVFAGFAMSSCGPSNEKLTADAKEAFDKNGYEVTNEMWVYRTALFGKRAEFELKKKGDTSQDPVKYTAIYADEGNGAHIEGLKQLSRVSNEGLKP